LSHIAELGGQVHWLFLQVELTVVTTTFVLGFAQGDACRQTSPQVLQLSFVPSRVQTPLQHASPLAHRLPQLPQFWIVLSEIQFLPLQQPDRVPLQQTPAQQPEAQFLPHSPQSKL
jgi:hypothetical protein